MTVPVFLLAACEVELTIVAVGLGLNLRPTWAVAATAAIAGGFALAVFGLWAMWFVAPGCIVNSDCEVPASSYANLVAGAAAQWTWLLAVALGARFVKSRNLAHVSG